MPDVKSAGPCCKPGHAATAERGRGFVRGFLGAVQAQVCGSASCASVSLAGRLQQLQTEHACLMEQYALACPCTCTPAVSTKGESREQSHLINAVICVTVCAAKLDLKAALWCLSVWLLLCLPCTQSSWEHYHVFCCLSDLRSFLHRALIFPEAQLPTELTDIA